MESFNFRDLLAPALVFHFNVLFAWLLHRAIMFNSELVRRRQFFEALAILGFIVALGLSVSGALLWKRHEAFVLTTCVIWALFCSFVVSGLWIRYRRRTAEAELEIPDLWSDMPVSSLDDGERSLIRHSAGGTLDNAETSVPGATSADASPVTVLDSQNNDGHAHPATCVTQDSLDAAHASPTASGSGLNVTDLKTRRDRLKRGKGTAATSVSDRSQRVSGNLAVYRRSAGRVGKASSRQEKLRPQGDG